MHFIPATENTLYKVEIVDVFCKLFRSFRNDLDFKLNAYPEMIIKEIKGGKEVEVTIETVSEKDYKQLRKNKSFQFKWNQYKGKEVFKLCPMIDNVILGLICIVDHTDPYLNAIEIELLEVGMENVGKNKKLEHIAGCLIAFACRESFKRGHEGYFFLTPKTEIIGHYSNKYYLDYLPPIGLKLTGMMVGNEKVARKLIKEYLE